MRVTLRVRRCAAGLIGMVATLSVLATVLVAAPASAATPVGWGGFFGPSTPQANPDNRPFITAAEDKVGRQFVYDARYDVFGRDQVITDREQWSKAHGKTLVIHLSVGACWTPGCHSKPTWGQVANGTYDAYIKQQAAEIKAYGDTVLFNFGNEPNISSHRRGTPAQYRAAYNHVVAVFRASGVTNARYAITPTNGVYLQGKGDDWYPGDSTVDYIAPTGYNWACTPGYPDSGQPACTKRWRSFQQVFVSAYAYAVKHQKKLFVAETGSGEATGKPGMKAQWIKDMAHTAKSWPSLAGIIWFAAGVRESYWAIDSSQTALAAYTCVGHDPAFGGSGPACPGT